MTASAIFQFINLIALIGWLLLIIVPQAKITISLVRSGVIILLTAGVYFILIVSYFRFDSFMNFISLEGIMDLFKDPMGVVAGWAHYLAFDLFVGVWITKNAEIHKIARPLLILSQILTFMFGPLGLLFYYTLRFFKTKTLPTQFLNSPH
jgi:hypothetical protein